MQWTPARPEEPRLCLPAQFSWSYAATSNQLHEVDPPGSKYPPNISLILLLLASHSVWLRARLSIILGGMRLKDEFAESRKY